jgi:hypothetical protein
MKEALLYGLGTILGIVLFILMMYCALFLSLWEMQRDIRKKSGSKKWSIWKMLDAEASQIEKRGHRKAMNYEEETATMGDKPCHGTDDGSRDRTK